jgi:hypothetical protein
VTGGAAGAGAGASASTARADGPRLAPGERAPYDPDAT